jgi:hypothetical protein
LDEVVADPDKSFDWGSDLVDIPDEVGKLEAGEVVAAVDEDEDNAVAEVAEDNEAGFVEEAKDLTGRESDAGDGVELVEGDKAIGHLKEVHMDQSGRELVDKAFELLVLVMTGQGIRLGIHEAGSRDVKELAGCTDSSADEGQEDTKIDSTGLKHVRGEERDSGEGVDLVEVNGRRRELVGIDELPGWNAGHGEDDLVQIGVPWIPVDAWQVQSHWRPAEAHVSGDDLVTK